MGPGDESGLRSVSWRRVCGCRPQILICTAIALKRSDLTVAKREEYIKAELCLHLKPAKVSLKPYGAKNRFDDFVVQF
ncbi:hypothetical protein CONLIGDRAFT_635317 [Coniochaeta ligniaria NRRL 30616]|uniref:Uncharacterized protein n=1 Tax=Coniochaeta ligniaria NRRL 30616 TaxID=1408157 RepID=A0A1J7IIC7_9PEZI|nr:hypothetical protein CONLIGDRAFT_635317 [Coniochaeta ligniaria NRRL 30616]